MSRALPLLAVLCVAAPLWAQDPVAVDPAHHKVVLENDDVRVLAITMGPGEKTPPHDHPVGIAVFMNDLQNRVSPVGGQPDETLRKRGQTTTVAAGKHVVENIGKGPSRVMLVELKNPAGSAAAMSAANDAVKIDAKHYKVELENDRARVLRISYGPGEKSIMHAHPATVVVMLTDANMKFTMGGASGNPNRPTTSKAGDVMFSEPETHLPENTGDKPFEAILVELKTRAKKM